MKLENKIDRNPKGPLFGFTEKRIREIQIFIDELIKCLYNGDVNKIDCIERIIEFADTTLEAVVINGWLEARVTTDEIAGRIAVEMKRR